MKSRLLISIAFPAHGAYVRYNLRRYSKPSGKGSDGHGFVRSLGWLNCRVTTKEGYGINQTSALSNT